MKKNETKEIENVRKYLESYGAAKRLLRMMRYEKEYFSEESDESDVMLLPCGDEILLKSKLYEIRRFILNIEDGKEKALLFYHYIKGFSVEKCSEMMNVGRTSAFRIKKRALEKAAVIYASKIKTTKNAA